MPLPAGTRAERIFPRHGTESGPVTLTQRRVYILPTRQGLLFAATLALLLIGSINYNLSLGYVLTFLLAGLGIVAMLHTWRNLANLVVRRGRVNPVFAGEHAIFEVALENRAGFERWAIGIERSTWPATFTNLAPANAESLPLTVATERRGWIELGRFRVFSSFPLGLFQAWSNVALDERCLVYPRPEAGEPPLPPVSSTAGDGGAHGRGAEDFAGLREYHPGDSLRHVAWKAFARGDQLLTKQFSGRSGTEFWLDWKLLPHEFSVEQKLSRLARWILTAESEGINYGLRLPTRELAPGGGALHRDACLEALALFEPQVAA